MLELFNTDAKSRSEYNSNKRELFLEFVRICEFRQSYYKMLHSNLNSVNDKTGWRSTLELLDYYPIGELFVNGNVISDMQRRIVKFLHTSPPVNPVLTVLIRLLFFPSDYIRQYINWTLGNTKTIEQYLSKSRRVVSATELRSLLDFHKQTLNQHVGELSGGALGLVSTAPKMLLALKKVGVSKTMPRLTKLLGSLRTKVPLSLKKLSSNIAQKEILDSADKYKRTSKRKRRKRKN